MIVDIYNSFKEEPGNSNLVGSDFLIMEYKCPIEIEKYQLLTEAHFISFVISGRKDWITSGKVIQVKSGDALFLRKGIYTTRQYFEEDYCVMLFFINDDFIRKFMLENQLFGNRDEEVNQLQQVYELDVNESMHALFYSISNYLKMETEIPRNLVEIKFKELLYNILLNKKHKEIATFFTSLMNSGKSNIDDVMMKNFQYDLQLDEFARLCGRSLSAFKRDFKKCYHQTPGEWLKDKRLEFARSLLLGSGLSVNEVCYESGFRNSSHFNKAFKEKYQLPPKQFRLQSEMV